MFTQKFLYIVDHFVPFPSSEYGGVWNVIAKDDNECFDLISEYFDDEYYVKFYSELRENIQNGDCFPLSDLEESRVVMSFTT